MHNWRDFRTEQPESNRPYLYAATDSFRSKRYIRASTGWQSEDMFRYEPNKPVAWCYLDEMVDIFPEWLVSD